MRKLKFVKGNIYHIFNRGVEKRDLFLDESDKWRFLQGMFLFNDKDGATNLLWRIEREKKRINFKVLREFIAVNRKDRKPLVRIMADCLMPNHFHFLVEEIEDKGISRFMHKFGIGYTKYFNEKYERVGSLFQGPFKAVQVEKEIQLLYLLVYINVLNPGQLVEPHLKKLGVRNMTAILKFAEQYPWSTHQEYLGKRDSVLIDKGVAKELFSEPAMYERFARDILEGKRRIGASKELLFE